jgi:hypothetical protein
MLNHEMVIEEDEDTVTNTTERESFESFRNRHIEKQIVINQAKIKLLRQQITEATVKLKLNTENFRTTNRKPNRDNIESIKSINHDSTRIIAMLCQIIELENYGNLDTEELVS